jgi:predicted NBD/HSP70 family sugar kinase
VDVRVEQVSMAMVGIGGQILGRHSWNLHRTTRLPGEVITHVAESAQLLSDELGVRAQSVGVSVPGVVRRSDGLVREAPNLGWREVALGERLAAVLGAPTQVANDAELGALAEHLRGAARESADLVYLSADVGVGGGVIVGGQPLRGTGGYVGELGHMIVRPGGRSCFCGAQGCWETEIGEPALCRALGLPEDTPRGVLVAELRGLERVDLLDEVAEWLVTGLVTVVNMLAPELVVLGDLFAVLPSSLVERMGREVSDRSLVSRAAGGTRIAVSPLGRDGKLVGAAELAFEPVLGAV